MSLTRYASSLPLEGGGAHFTWFMYHGTSRGRYVDSQLDALLHLYARNVSLTSLLQRRVGALLISLAVNHSFSFNPVSRLSIFCSSLPQQQSLFLSILSLQKLQHHWDQCYHQHRHFTRGPIEPQAPEHRS